MDVGSSELHECTLRGVHCKSEKGFVFDQGTFRELVDVPASEEQKKKGIKSSGVKYHSLVAETGAILIFWLIASERPASSCG
jgi:hypothetical protein